MLSQKVLFLEFIEYATGVLNPNIKGSPIIGFSSDIVKSIDIYSNNQPLLDSLIDYLLQENMFIGDLTKGLIVDVNTITLPYKLKNHLDFEKIHIVNCCKDTDFLDLFYYILMYNQFRHKCDPFILVKFHGYKEKIVFSVISKIIKERYLLLSEEQRDLLRNNLYYTEITFNYNSIVIG